jgi:hypothetical protein
MIFILKYDLVQLLQPVLLVIFDLHYLFRPKCNPQHLKQLAEVVKWKELLQVVIC